MPLIFFVWYLMERFVLLIEFIDVPSVAPYLSRNPVGAIAVTRSIFFHVPVQNAVSA
jgi:hypothetical protein